MLSYFKEQLQNLLGENYTSLKYAVATSGGVDSMVLALLCKKANLHVVVAHCNFQLRGTESDEDEKLVLETAKLWGLPAVAKKMDTKAYVTSNKVGVQVAARELRYQWFQALVADNQADIILLGHHENDQIETFFINLFRGAGLKGLTGIKAVNKHIVRPLLEVDKEDIYKYAQLNKMPYREDSSNSSDKYMRNQIRLELLPLIKKIRPSALSKISEEMQYLNQAWDELSVVLQKKKEEAWEEKEDQVFIHKKIILACKNPILYLIEWLNPYGFNSAQLSDVLYSENIGTMVCSKDYCLLNDREFLILKTKEQGVNQATCISQIPYIGDHLQVLEAKPEEVTYEKGNKKVFVDAHAVKLPLTYRKWQEGDYIKPFGMKGKRKKVSDILIDAKVNVYLKGETMVLVDNSGEIIFIPQHCIAESVRIKKTTQKIWLMKIV